MTREIALVVVSLIVLVAIMLSVKWLGSRFSWRPELARKGVHVATGLYATFLPFMFGEVWPVLLLVGIAAAAMLVLRLPRLAKDGLGSTLHGVERNSYGELLLAAAIGVVFALSIGNPVLYVLPMAVLTLSDAAAALVGTRYGRKFFEVEAGTKSAEGVAAFFLVTWIVAMVVLLLLSDIGRGNVILLSVIIAAFGAMVEADSWHGLDNLFVPVGIYLFLAGHIATPPLDLLVLAATFALVLVAVVALAPAVGMSAHAARGYTVFVFLICAVTPAYNAILPVIAILAHLGVAKVRPWQSAHPNLDFLAALSTVAVFWLAIGEITHINALHVYNLTFAGTALAILALAPRLRLVLAGAAAAGLVALLFVIAGWNAARTSVHDLPWPWIAASFLPCLLVPLRWPQFLDRYRGARTLALAMPVPIVAFISIAVRS
jgi:phytol kinase